MKFRSIKMNKEDIEIAKKARLFSHSPYSNFQVGAALRTKSGKVYMGCNIENHALLAICGERTAFLKAISEGENEFESITIVGAPKGVEPTEECMPCGYCRQFMSEFVDKDFKIITVDKNIVKEYTMEEILPYSFKI